MPVYMYFAGHINKFYILLKYLLEWDLIMCQLSVALMLVVSLFCQYCSGGQSEAISSFDCSGICCLFVCLFFALVYPSHFDL